MSCPVSDQCRLVSNHQAIRIDFFAPGSGVYAVRFHSKEGFAAFTDAYRDALFENTHRMRASDENKEKVNLNKQLPYLVGHVVEVLDNLEDEEDDGAAQDANTSPEKAVVVKTSTRQVRPPPSRLPSQRPGCAAPLSRSSPAAVPRWRSPSARDLLSVRVEL